ncbi:vomeronasal type-2 receptor 26-like [Protopterus annectens]|uniref:vomeronasal type-2 receptor 26-like n=1 Tax=Protopterus annectens TaxID=7888 RepID=UPI001CFB456A|nr:vomeronasal type-2 receptor 26-like [Protopterus annectens]
MIDEWFQMEGSGALEDWLAQQTGLITGSESAQALWTTTLNVPPSFCSESCSPGHRKATRQGTPVCCFDCVLCSKGEITNQTDAIACLKCPENEWSNGKQNKCILKQVEFLSFDDPLGIALSSIAVFCCLITLTICIIFSKNNNTPIVKANNRELSYVLLLTLMMCFLCCFIFIGRPQPISCMLRQVAFGVVFSFAVSCILTKTVIVIVAFSATKPGSKLKKWAELKIHNVIIIFCTALQIGICIIWLTTSPPSPEQNTKSETEKIILECNEGSGTAYWSMMGYMGILASVSLIVAFLARKLPDSFNEAKYITFSMIVVLSVWFSFIPAYMSTKGKYMVAVEIFAILSSSSGILGCIFFPKCYIILLRPDMNTREHLIGKKVKD